MPNIEEYHDFGIIQQKKIKPILENIFGELIEFEDRYSKFDYMNHKFNIELKSRINVKITTFSKTLLALNKIKECEGKELIFVFNFVCNGLNEIYYIKYDKKVFELFDTELVEYFDGTNKLHYLIPSPLLILLHKDKPKCLLKVR
jgi:hypothetical protein